MVNNTSPPRTPPPNNQAPQRQCPGAPPRPPRPGGIQEDENGDQNESCARELSFDNLEEHNEDQNNHGAGGHNNIVGIIGGMSLYPNN
tara:strand:- start:140 stop:403 length:264 start_codon:yes stop_codon:yes gene_type:complete